DLGEDGVVEVGHWIWRCRGIATVWTKQGPPDFIRTLNRIICEVDINSLSVDGEIEPGRIRQPREAADPPIQVFCQVLLLSRLPVIQHQPEAVALIPRTLLRAVRNP